MRFLLSLWLLCFVVAVPSAWAQCNPSTQCCAQQGTGQTCAESEEVASLTDNQQVGVGEGNPINVLSGNKFQREVDMPALPGVLGLEIVRFYNSYQAGKGGRNGLVGRGWRLSYETSMAKVGNAIEVYQADGTVLKFIASANGQFIHANAKLGYVVQSEARSPKPYVWHWPAVPGRLARELVFDQQGKLLEIAQSSGEFLSLAYDARGMLSEVTDPQGRKLSLHYAKQGFTGVAKIDSPLGEFHYRYGSELAPQALMEVSSASFTKHYHYEDARFPAYLTGMTVGNLRTNSWAYDARGFAVMSVRGKPEETTEKVSLSWPTNNTAIATRASGQRTQYTMATIAGQRRIVSIKALDCQTCTAQTFAYDEQGQRQRDERSEGPRLVEFTDPRHPFLPTTIQAPSTVPGKQRAVKITYNEFGQITRATEQGFSPVDSEGTPSAMGHPIERSTRYTYQLVNNRSVFSGIEGNKTETYIWDERGSRILRIEHPMGFATRYHYDAIGRLAGTQFNDGVREITNEQQLSANPLSALQATSLRRSAKFVATGASRTSADPELIMAASYNERGLRTQTTNRWGEKSTLTYGANNKPLTLTLANGDQQYLHFDEKGRLQAQVTQDAQGKLVHGDLLLRDEQGKLMAHLTPQGVKTAYAYLPERTAIPSNTGPRIRLQDDFGRTVLERHPEDGQLTTVFVTTAHGERQTQFHTGTDGKSLLKETLEFDQAGRLTRRERGACTDTLRYDGMLLSELQGCTSTTRYERDPWGRITAQHQTIDTTRYTQRYTYDAKGVLTARTLPFSDTPEHSLSYGYTANGKTLQTVRLQAGWLAAITDLLSKVVPESVIASLPVEWLQTALLTKIESNPGVPIAAMAHGNGTTQDWRKNPEEHANVQKVALSAPNKPR